MARPSTPMTRPDVTRLFVKNVDSIRLNTLQKHKQSDGILTQLPTEHLT